MVSPVVQDLFALDREIARAVAALTRWRAALEDDAEAHADQDPFGSFRHVAARSTWQALAELSPSVADVPLRDALGRWVAALVHARIGVGDDVARARAMAEATGRFEGDPPRRVSWRQAWRGVPAAHGVRAVHLWLDAAADCAEPLAAANRSRAARRVEVGRRMGHGHPWEAAVGVPRATLRASAAKLLDATDDLSRAVWKETLATADGLAPRLDVAAARDAGEGWPARLTPGFFAQIFGEGLRGLPIAMPAMPRLLGAASFARALSAFGFAVRTAASPSSLPFALAREPAFVEGYRLGFALGALPADVEFHLKGLRLARRVALAQARDLTRTALFDARLHAARLLLGDDDAFAPADLFTELAIRVFGAPLDARFRGAWPAARDDEAARWVALLASHALRDALREQFDNDWFRNPHAWSHLREQGASGIREPVAADSLEPAAVRLGLAFEEALG